MQIENRKCMRKYIRNSGIIDSNDNERFKKGTTKMLKNPEQTKNEIVEWIRDYFKKNGPDCDAVVGVSGGKDSSVVAALLAGALGKDRVVGVMMQMEYRVTSVIHRRLYLC